MAAFDGGSNIFTSVLAAFGSFPKSMVEETLGFKDFQDTLKAKGWNDDEILGNKSLTNVISDPFGAAESGIRTSSGYDILAASANMAGDELEQHGVKHASKIGNVPGESADDMGFQKSDEFLKKDVDWGEGISNTLQAVLEEGKGKGMSSKAISVSRPKPIMKGNVALEPEIEISHNTATLAYKPDEIRNQFVPEGYI